MDSSLSNKKKAKGAKSKGIARRDSLLDESGRVISAAEQVKSRKANELYRQAQSILRANLSHEVFEEALSLVDEAVTLRPQKSTFFALRSRCFGGLGDFEKALRDISAAITLDTSNAKYFAARAMFCRKLNRLHEALKDYSEAVKCDNSNSEYFFRKGLVNAELEEYESAVIDFTLALDKRLAQPANGYFHRGVACRQLGQLDQSSKDLSHALTLDSANADAHNELGITYREQGIIELAYTEFSQALALGKGGAKSETVARYSNNQGLSLLDLSNHAEAIACFTDAIALIAGNGEYFYNRGRALFLQGNLEQALVDLSHAVRLDNTNALYFFQLGITHENLECWSEAMQDYTKTLTCDPTLEEASFRLAEMYRRKQNYNEALATLSDLSDSEKRFETRALIFREMATDESLRQSIVDFSYALQFNPNSASHYYNRGQVKLMLNDNEAALQDLDNSIILGEGNLLPLSPQDEEIIANDRQKQAEATMMIMSSFEKNCTLRGGTMMSAEWNNIHINNNTSAEPSEPRPRLPLMTIACMHNDKATAFRALNQLREAIRELTEAIEKCKSEEPEPTPYGNITARSTAKKSKQDQTTATLVNNAKDDAKRTEFLASRAQCYYDMNEHELSEADLAQALSMHGNNPLLSYRRGITRYAQSQYVESIRDFKHSLENIVPEEYRGSLYYHLGVAYANLGKHPLAVPAFDEAVCYNSDSPQYLHERAKSLQSCGDHENAVQDFSRVLLVQPRNARALFRRAISFSALGCYEEAADDFETAKEIDPNNPLFEADYNKLTQVTSITLVCAGKESDEIEDKNWQNHPLLDKQPILETCAVTQRIVLAAAEEGDDRPPSSFMPHIVS